MDISWLKDKSLADLDNLPDPDVFAEDIIENLEAGLASFREIMLTLNTKQPSHGRKHICNYSLTLNDYSGVRELCFAQANAQTKN